MELLKEVYAIDEVVPGLHNPELADLARLHALIEAEYKNHRTIAFYTDATNLSVRALNRLTQVYCSRSLVELINERLLHASKLYLTNSSLPFKWVTYELGFQDPAYFSRWFKKLTGMNPREYRRKYFRLKAVSDPF